MGVRNVTNMVPATLLKPLENGIYLLTVTPLQSFWECNGKIPGFPGFFMYPKPGLGFNNQLNFFMTSKRFIFLVLVVGKGSSVTVTRVIFL